MTARSYTTPRFLLRGLLRKAGLEVSKYRPRGQEKFPEAIEQGFIDLYKKYHEFSMVKWPGLYTAYRAANYIKAHKIEGDIVECGVWKGGCTAILAEILKDEKAPRDFYLYDTYEGMSAPTEVDRSMSTNISANKLYHQYDEQWSVGSLDTVKQVMGETGYEPRKLHYVKGKVEDTIPKTIPKKIALLRLDTDWYESTKHELEHLYDLLVPGGVLIIDDYGSWAGSKKAVEEFFKDRPMPFMNYDAHTCNLSGVKVEEK
tara:strand:- start:145360 stop:146136 length:777 start_codon:yes stop_codon:yes gene_type:complete